MKKFFITLMCIVMVVCFMPTVAMAGGAACTGECMHAAAIGSVHYDTLQEAFNASQSGDTIVMLRDFENADLSNGVNFSLKDKVTLDGKGHEIRGNSSVYMYTGASGNSTIQNVTFKYIHNGSMASESDCKWYGWVNGKQGTKSAVYASSLQGTANIVNCTFDNADWDAIQMTPKAGATINITGNTFSHSSTVDYSQLRYIHIQPSTTISANVTIKNNNFYNTKNPNADSICNIGIWYVNNNGTIDLTGNWFEEKTGKFNCEFSNQKLHQLYPIKSEANANSADVPLPYVAYIGSKYYRTLQEAFDAAKTASSTTEVYLCKDVTVDNTLKFENSNSQRIYLYLNGFELKGNNCTPIEFATMGCNTFTYNGIISATGGYPAVIYSGDAKLYIGSSGTASVNTNGAIKSTGTGDISIYGGRHIGAITGNGKIDLQLGTYSFEPNKDQYNKYKYKVVADAENSWSIVQLTEEDLNATGYKVAVNSSYTERYPSISDAIANGATSVYLLDDISENLNLQNTGLYIYTNGHTLTGNITVDAEGKSIYLRNKNGGSINGDITIKKGTAYVYATVDGNIVNNSSLFVDDYSSYGTGDVKGTITNNATFSMGSSKASINNLDNKSTGIVSISAGTVTGTITNETNGAIKLTGGNYKQNPATYAAFGYAATYNDTTSYYTVAKLSWKDAEAIEQGAKVRYNKETSSYRRYYKSIADALNDGKYSVHLLKDVTENINYSGTSTLDLYCGSCTFTGSLSCPGKTIYIDNGTAILDNIECNTFYGGFGDYSASITVKNGTATNIKVAKNANVTIEGGTYTGTITVASDGNGSLTIKGGTFSTNVSAYIPGGYVEYAMRDGTYIVKAATDPKPDFTTGNDWSDLVGKVYTEMYSAPYVPSTPSTPTDNVTNSGTAGTDNATTSADLSGSTTTSNDTTATAVDKTTADKIVDKAVANKSQEVVIDATANTAAAAASTTIAQVTIPTETLGAIAEKTEADVTVKTDVAEVKMDNAAAAAVSEQATGDTVQIVAEKVKEDAEEVHFELKVVCSNGTVISDFKGGNVAVTVTLPKEMADKKVVCVYIDDNGHMSKVEGQKNADGTYTFVTGHFSSYAIMAEEEADAAIAAQTEAIKNIKIKLTSKQVKTKSGKKGIKITWTAAAGDKTLDGVEVFRSKEKNKGYGTKAFFTSTKGGNKGSYINTKSLKKGTRYYYKVRGYVLVNGEKVYTDYSTKAWRTVK